jgi:hypothetical protein
MKTGVGRTLKSSILGKAANVGDSEGHLLSHPLLDLKFFFINECTPDQKFFKCVINKHRRLEIGSECEF